MIRKRVSGGVCIWDQKEKRFAAVWFLSVKLSALILSVPPRLVLFTDDVSHTRDSRTDVEYQAPFSSSCGLNLTEKVVFTNLAPGGILGFKRIRLSHS